MYTSKKIFLSNFEYHFCVIYFLYISDKKQITVNNGHFTCVIYVEIFQVDKDKQKIVTRINN